MLVDAAVIPVGARVDIFMIGNLKLFDLHSLAGLTLNKVELAGFILKLFFENEIIINVEEYWEYLDKDLKLIDRAYSSKFRKSFFVPELVGSKLLKVEKLLSQISFLFDNEKSLIISTTDDVKRSDFISQFIQMGG